MQDFDANIRFYPMLVDSSISSQYPKPFLPMLPIIKFNCFNKKRSVCATAFIEHTLNFSQGRYGLHYIVNKLIQKKITTILIPAYHCRSMIEPLLDLNINIIFYHHTKDLYLTIHDLKEATSSLDNRFALLIIHYFGFPQKYIEDIAKYCVQNNIKLIEDCAHSFFAYGSTRPPGSYGDYAIASTRKFLPVSDGGIVLDNEREDNSLQKAGITPQPLINEFKTILKLLISLLRPNPIAPSINEPVVLDYKSNSSLNNNEDYFHIHNANMAGLKTNQFLTHFISNDDICKKRRENYQHWLDLLEDRTHFKPLYPYLDKGTVPYVFPLIILNNAEHVFHCLKCHGIPIWRWEDIAITECLISEYYRKSLIQLPCHQSLTKEEIEWMVNCLINACNAS